jgi:hypothetical protein
MTCFLATVVILCSRAKGAYVQSPLSDSVSIYISGAFPESYTYTGFFGATFFCAKHASCLSRPTSLMYLPALKSGKLGQDVKHFMHILLQLNTFYIIFTVNYLTNHKLHTNERNCIF